jgi:hypothetical protein
MNVGMLWFDNDTKRTLEQKIKRAVDYYIKKYGRVPEMCLVNPGMSKDLQLTDLDRLTVRAYRPVLPGHLWIGIEDESGMSSEKPEPLQD